MLQLLNVCSLIILVNFFCLNNCTVKQAELYFVMISSVITYYGNLLGFVYLLLAFSPLSFNWNVYS